MEDNHAKDRARIVARGGEGTVAAAVFSVAVAVVLLLIWPGSIVLHGALVLAVFLTVFMLCFFRDPARKTGPRPGFTVSPADGTVVAITEEFEGRYLDEHAVRISIFLSIFNVHVQRMPVSGRVLAVDYRPGKFLQAFRPEASESNESVTMVLQSDLGRVVVRQIAGILARRCVNYAGVGEYLAAGRRFGLIRFGSRVDLFLPAGSQIMVKEGDRVYGGLSAVARLVAGEIK